MAVNADIVKQKMAVNNGGYNALELGKTHPKVYSDLTSDHPIGLVRYQVANRYMGRNGMINSGGEPGQNDVHDAVRAGGMGLISGRKAFQKSIKDGVALLNAIQDVYLSRQVSIA